MRFSIAVVLAGILLALEGPAFAQGLGNEVQVNPGAAGGGNTLLYPGGQYMRVVPPLLMPGQTMAPVRLHMPRKGERRAVAQTAEAAPAPKPKPAPKTRTAAATPPPASAPADTGGFYNGFGGGIGASGIFGGGTAPAPAPATSPAKPAAPPKPQQLAKAEPAPPAATGIDAGLSKRSVILFAPQAADPAETALGAIKFLAGDLNAAMTSATSRIQLQAFGGQRGDKGSDARRLSLKRALAIRQVLIDDGVSAERIDVRAMGGADDNGPSDRVDIYVKA